MATSTTSKPRNADRNPTAADHANLAKSRSAPRCNHIRYNGQRCAAPARSGSDYCIFHGYEYEGRVAAQAVVIEPVSLRNVIIQVAENLDDFIRWPGRALLLWQGCDRVAPEGENRRYHVFPDEIKRAAKQQQFVLDRRPNGPAKAAFFFAGGERPERFGSTHAWTIHHLYSGKFPYIGRETTTHAIKQCNHFTQSAGIIAAHPVADSLCDEFPFFAWLLRAMAFKKFGYDPDGVFAKTRDGLGFAEGRNCEIVVPFKTYAAPRES